MGNSRIAIIAGFITLAYGAILFNLYDIQIARGDRYLARAGMQYSATGVLRAKRGTIYFSDKNGNHVPAAVNKEFPTVYAVPAKVEDPLETAHALAPLVGLSGQELARKLESNKSYVVIQKKADPETVQKIQEQGNKGIYVEHSYYRYYPMGTIASQVLGFVSPSEAEDQEIGRYGVEKQFEDSLAGRAGFLIKGEVRPSQPGEDVTLTIDPTLQSEAERILDELVVGKKAKGGTVIVQNPMTGDILAMAGNPRFDPNAYSDSPIAWFVNPATQQLYEPGSVFKVLTMSAGIDSGKITPDTTYVDTGSLTLNGFTIRNWDKKAYGRTTMTSVIEHSINTGAAFAERQTGNDIFKSYMDKFGFREKTNIELPGELKGNLRELFSKDAPEVAFATASYGQGVAVTPIQIISAFSAIANGGNLMEPHIIFGAEPKVVRRVVSKESAQAVREMMISALDKAKIAKVENYSLAGKTGTAFVPENGRYNTDRVINTYIGFGPTTSPKFTVLIKLVEPEGAPIAGLTVVPSFKKLAQFLINYYQIPPDRIGR